jgi:hypothetical protein
MEMGSALKKPFDYVNSIVFDMMVFEYIWQKSKKKIGIS